jgi:CBS domain-containing protein
VSDQQETGDERSAYLLDGRRVTISDLIDGGLLTPGTNLKYRRPRAGQTHRAVVTQAGTISLEEGQEFRSPSRAAVVAADVSAIDGWHAWTVEPGHRSLDSLRQELLDQVATGAAGQRGNDHGEEAYSQRRYEMLKDARAKADAGTPVEMSVRDLLILWGAKARGTRVNQRIEADLGNHGLAASPSFRKVTIDATVHLVTALQEAESTGHPPVDVDDETDLNVGLTVGNLPSALSEVASVTPSATFDEAITLMALNGYSQLAVLSGRHTLRGAVTWQSIAYARHANPEASFADAIVPAREARYDQELLDVLPDLQAWDFVFVRDEKNAVCGIVTTADVVGAYKELSTPFFLIGELDQLLRQIIARTFTMGEVTALCDKDGSRSLLTFDELEIGDYQRVLENPGLWQKLGWPLDRATFIKRLDELRYIRNNVVHFNPEPVPPGAVDKLRYILKLLRDYMAFVTQ